MNALFLQLFLFLQLSTLNSKLSTIHLLMSDYPDPESAFAPVIHTDPEPASRDIGKPPMTYRAHGGADEARDEKERQQAFDSAFAWHGRELLPFSSSRYGLFAQHRLAVGAPDLQKCLDDLDAFFPDACRLLWLCSHPPEAWSRLRCEPELLQQEIDRWSDENIACHESGAAVLLAFRVYAASRVNEHETAPSSGKGHGDDLGN